MSSVGEPGTYYIKILIPFSLDFFKRKNKTPKNPFLPSNFIMFFESKFKQKNPEEEKIRICVDP